MHRVAAIQMCSSLSVDENLANAAILIQNAAEQGAKLVVLPEMFPVIGAAASDKISVQEKPGAGKIQDFLQRQAQQHQLWIIGGTIPLASDQPNKIRAACLVYDDQGILVARYDKIHLFDMVISPTEYYRESDSTEAGNQTVVINTPFGKIGLAVCYDIRFAELFLELKRQGAEIIAIPAAFTVPTGEAHWHMLARARAVENYAYVIGACQGGTHANGRKTYGHSLIVDPWGKIIAEQTANTGVISAEIDLNYLQSLRAKSGANF